MIIVYGISNCNTVKKARAWLTMHGLDHAFHDFKKQGVPADKLAHWASTLGWDTLINRRGTTWRTLGMAKQGTADTPNGAYAMALAMPSVIKRPVVEWASAETTAGFDAAHFAETLSRLRG